MWQLGIIIEISGRKELLGPIWSLPGGQAALFPSVCSLVLCPSRGVYVGDSILCSDFHSTLDLILTLVLILPSAWSSYFTCCEKEVLGRNEKELFSNGLVISHVN